MTGPEAKTTESHLVARPRKGLAASASASADATCRAVEDARKAAKAPPPPEPAVERVLFPARVFDPYFPLGLILDEETLDVLAVAPSGQGRTLGVCVGWRAVATGSQKAPLGRLPDLVGELTKARQTRTRCRVWFEGDALE